MDYTKYLLQNKHKVYKKLIKLKELKPTDKLHILNIEEYKDKRKRGEKWELEILKNDNEKVYWRMSASIFEQIATFNQLHNISEFYVIPIEKTKTIMKDGKVFEYSKWILKISASPMVDSQNNPNTIIEKETKHEQKTNSNNNQNTKLSRNSFTGNQECNRLSAKQEQSEINRLSEQTREQNPESSERIIQSIGGSGMSKIGALAAINEIENKINRGEQITLSDTSQAKKEVFEIKEIPKPKLFMEAVNDFIDACEVNSGFTNEQKVKLFDDITKYPSKERYSIPESLTKKICKLRESLDELPSRPKKELEYTNHPLFDLIKRGAIKVHKQENLDYTEEERNKILDGIKNENLYEIYRRPNFHKLFDYLKNKKDILDDIDVIDGDFIRR